MSQYGFPHRALARDFRREHLTRRGGEKREGKTEGKTKGAPPRAPTKPKEGDARTRAPQGGAKEEPVR